MRHILEHKGNTGMAQILQGEEIILVLNHSYTLLNNLAAHQVSPGTVQVGIISSSGTGHNDPARPISWLRAPLLQDISTSSQDNKPESRAAIIF